MITKFKVPGFCDSIVQERMMRVGIEAHGISDVNEIYQAAIKTLREDFQRYPKTSILSDDNIKSLFKRQVFNGLYYFMTEIDGELQILKCHDLTELDAYGSGDLNLSPNQTIPRLYLKQEKCHAE